jgi:uncharacterized protein (TIGR02145 family)
MKTKTILSVTMVVMMVGVFAQKPSMTLTFSAENNGQHILLNSILLENLTLGNDTTLYDPDTVVVLDYIAGISENETDRASVFTVSQNYPNPMQGKTTVNLYLPENDYVFITIRDILGKELMKWENFLNQGKHSITFFPGSENLYFLTGRVNHQSQTIKMINTPSQVYVTGICRLEYNGETNVTGIYKSGLSLNNFVVRFGDQLKFTASTTLGNRTIIDTPYGNQNYTFQYGSGGIPCPGSPSVTYEDQVYNTVLIGSQCWLAENLNVGTMVIGSQYQTNNGIIEKYCYNNNTANCNTYGGLYQWDEMMGYTTTPGVQGICPPGWHIPTDDEWKVLEGTVDSKYGVDDPVWNMSGWRGFDAGKNLKSTSGWISGGNGTNLYGFGALPGGSLYSDGLFYYLDSHGRWWSSNEGSVPGAWRRSLDYNNDVSYRSNYTKTYGRSVRCLKDNDI